MSVPAFLQKIIDWLRVGYPEGVPSTDYIPLFSVLSTHLTEDDVRDFAAELASLSDEDTAKAIDEALAGCLSCDPPAEELARVRARLAAGGWPLARPDLFGDGNPGEAKGM